MKWQWKLGRFAGIDVFIHATFLLLIGCVVHLVGVLIVTGHGKLSKVI